MHIIDLPLHMPPLHMPTCRGQTGAAALVAQRVVTATGVGCNARDERRGVYCKACVVRHVMQGLSCVMQDLSCVMHAISATPIKVNSNKCLANEICASDGLQAMC